MYSRAVDAAVLADAARLDVSAQDVNVGERAVLSAAYVDTKIGRTSTMLTLTPVAAAEIRNIVDQPEVPDGGGLRIAHDSAAGSLTLSLAAVPAEDDRVLDESGARVFLDPEAAAILDDKTLDVTSDNSGQIQFAIAPQSG
jgi:Fe-S cluster assembly iron-binding protein IscA